MQMTIVWNWFFGVVALSSFYSDVMPVELVSRYLFSQFWAEFSRDVISEFYYEDVEIFHKERMKLLEKQKELEAKKIEKEREKKY